MGYNLTSAVYRQLYTTLTTNSRLDYVKTFQSRFAPVRQGFERKDLYPFVFLSFLDMNPEELKYMPKTYEIFTSIGIVAMTYNDGDVNLTKLGSISTIENSSSNAGNQIKITNSSNHNLSSNDVVTINGTTNYDGDYLVVSASGTVFEVLKTYSSDESPSSGKWFIRKGIIELIEDIKGVLFDTHKSDNFGQGSSLDWNFRAVGRPNVTSLQPLLLSPYIEAKQINLDLRLHEDRNVAYTNV